MNASKDPMRIAARATVGAVAVVVLTLGLWRLRDILILLLLALTLAASLRPGVSALRRRKVPEPIAIFVFFALALGVLALFFWLAVPPALHQVEQALAHPVHTGSAHGVRHDVLAWVQRQLRNLPSGAAVLHPVATYGKKATEVVAGAFFTLAATWYCISERDQLIDLFTSLAPEEKRERARRTLVAIDERLGAYVRLIFMMVAAVAVVLSTGFYLVGLHYWLLVGGFVSMLEVIPVVGPLIGVLLVAVVGLSQSVHVMVLALVVVIAVRQIQDYVVNPHVMGGSVGLSPLTTLVTVAAVGVLFGPFAVILAIPVTSTVATLIDVLVLGHEPPETSGPRRRRPRRASTQASAGSMLPEGASPSCDEEGTVTR